MKKYPDYTVCIRTLGTAGEKYQRLLNSLTRQLHKPKKIIIYLAEGYDRPKETIGIEEYVVVKKGMVAQRALKYDEVDTEWMLLLDDDLDIAPNGISRLFDSLIENDADAIGIDAIPHHTLPLKQKIAMAALMSSIPRIWNNKKGYSVNILGTDNYNPFPKEIAWSTTNCGAAILCRKKDFLGIHFEDDLWLDNSPYAIPDDRVMFYKLHLTGKRILTQYNHGFEHLDAGSSMSGDRKVKIAYSIARNNYIFNKLYIEPYLTKPQKFLLRLLKPIRRLNGKLYRLIKRPSTEEIMAEKAGVVDAIKYIDHNSQSNIPTR